MGQGGGLRWKAGPNWLQHPLPVSDVEPPVELDARRDEVRHFFEAELLVQRHAPVVGEGNAADGGANPGIAKFREEPGVEDRADPLTDPVGREVDGDLRGKTIAADQTSAIRRAISSAETTASSKVTTVSVM